MKEIRTSGINASKSADNGDKYILEGRPIVFNEETTIRDLHGEYKEIIKPNALDKADLSDIRLLYNHDTSKVPLGRTPKTLQFKRDSAGLTMIAELPQTEDGKSVYESVKRGDLSGMSFAFKVPENGSSYDAKTNTRTITKIDKVYEFSITPFPAYPQTSVEARSQIDLERNRKNLIDQAKIKINKIRKVEIN